MWSENRMVYTMNEIGRKITDKLIEIFGSADFEIAFLPYKRSMWNSMESVYDECKASGAKVHCMPIPYICLRQNREVDCVKSEFSMFGDKAEPIETLERADFIAIHYQYEDHNKVTSLQPQYFTKALKERYHAKIVFLPYGLSMGNTHFALSPGCREVDYAFLEDEDNAARFIAAWQTQGVDFTGRVFPFGSAKMDIARDCTEKVIPMEWAESCSNHKVVLVCTSLAAYLSEPLTRLNKYRDCVNREMDNKHTVIFRPHPLMRQTIRSMTPSMEEQYEKMMYDFRCRRHERLIVDESEYLERALAVSDYLISDPSSVVKMWEETHKPYMVIV